MLRCVRSIFYFTEKKMAKTSAKKKVLENKTTSHQKKKKEVKLKYEDKSAGQPEMILIFERLKKLLKPYAKGVIKAYEATYGQINLVSHKPVEIAGRKREELWFVSALIQKGYVGLYYMPIYGYKELGKQIHPELMKCLKGKACFHIKKNDDELFKQIDEALALGYDAYKKMKWV